MIIDYNEIVIIIVINYVLLILFLYFMLFWFNVFVKLYVVIILFRV